MYHDGMPPQEIRKYLAMKPFRPFRLHVTDGSSYEVPDPMYIHVDLLNVTVGVGRDEETGLPQRSDLIAPNCVSRIEPLPAKPIEENTPGGNGNT